MDRSLPLCPTHIGLSTPHRLYRLWCWLRSGRSASPCLQGAVSSLTDEGSAGEGRAPLGLQAKSRRDEGRGEKAGLWGLTPGPAGTKTQSRGAKMGGRLVLDWALAEEEGGGWSHQTNATRTGMSYSVTNMSGFHQSIGFHLSFGGRAIAIVLSLQGTMMYGVFIKGAR